VKIQTADGTAGAPAYSFASEPTLGFYRSSAGIVTLNGSLSYTGNINGGAASLINWAGRLRLASPADGQLTLTNNAQTIGVELKVDALPVTGACGAGSPAVVAGSTPLAGSITVGTGGPTSCVVTFNGTAFPSAPFCTANVVTSTAGTTRAIGTLSTTAQVTLTPATAFVDSSVVAWQCISAK
jgi:hypothetical protein